MLSIYIKVMITKRTTRRKENKLAFDEKLEFWVPIKRNEDDDGEQTCQHRARRALV
jgi:hypothetical protein